MNITVVGNPTNFEETRRKFGDSHQYILMENGLAEQLQDGVLFDFRMNLDAGSVGVYRSTMGTIFLNSAATTLAQLGLDKYASAFFGFCGMPTFLDRELLETSLLRESDREALFKTCRALNTRYEVVADRVGLVTPRVICMIINEAYLALEEGIATKEDIDKAMRLGTNYPWGPIEWGDRIGVNNIRHLLEALHKNQDDGSYKISSLLK